MPLRSQPAAADGPIREVLSCVVPALALATSTQLFDGAHRCVRRIVVTRWFHAANGLGAARKMLITGDDGDTTEVEVYGGDENYEILPDTFAAPTGP